MIKHSLSTVNDQDRDMKRDHGVFSISYDGITITVTGEGNDLVIFATEDKTGDRIIIPRTGSGIFTNAFSAFGYTGIIDIRENSLFGVDITAQPESKKSKM